MPLDPAVVALIAKGAAEPRVSELTAPDARRLKSAIRTDKAPFAAEGPSQDIVVAGDAGSFTVRIYRPNGGTGMLPLILYLHGGGFVICDLDTHDGIARNLCGGTGAAVLSVGYRLAPEHPFPAGLDDAVAAFRFAVANAGELQVDPERIVLCGDSAGGNLAAATALRLRDEAFKPAPAGQALLYPVTDHPERGTASYSAFSSGFGLTRADMRWFWSHYAPGRPKDDAYLTPLRCGDLSELPQAFIAVGEYDVLRDEGEAYAERLRLAGVPTEARRYAGLNHNFFANLSSVPAVANAYDDLLAWLRGRLFY